MNSCWLDNNMQKVIIKDLLKVLFEKTVTLKNSLADRYRIHQVRFQYLRINKIIKLINIGF